MYLLAPPLDMSRGQGPERYLFLSPECQGTLCSLGHLDHQCLTEVPLGCLQGYLRLVSHPQGCCPGDIAAQSTLSYLLRRHLTMAMHLHPPGLYLVLPWLEVGLLSLFVALTLCPPLIMSSVSMSIFTGFTSVACSMTRTFFEWLPLCVGHLHI